MQLECTLLLIPLVIGAYLQEGVNTLTEEWCYHYFSQTHLSRDKKINK